MRRAWRSTRTRHNVAAWGQPLVKRYAIALTPRCACARAPALGHAHVDGGVLDELEQAAPRLCHLHLHDNDGRSDAHLAPGQGTIPWAQVLERLHAAGYQGAGALEVRDLSRGARPPAEVLAETLAASAAVLPGIAHPASSP